MEISSEVSKSFLDKACLILGISPSDPLDTSTIVTKAWHLGTQINLHKHTYNLSRDTKKNSYSKRVEKADQYLKKIKKFKSNILPLSPHQSGVPYNKMKEVDAMILQVTQSLSNQKSQNKITMHSSLEIRDEDNNYLEYEFDKKISELHELLDYLEKWMSETKNNFKQKKTSIKGKRQTRHSNELTIDLCNLYYELSGKKPICKSVNEYGITIVTGEIIDFLELCYRELEIKFTRSSLYQQFTKISSKSSDVVSRSHPLWL